MGPNPRTERPRKTKIGTEVAHITRDSDTTFKVKRSKVTLLLMSKIANMRKQVPPGEKYKDIVTPEQYRHLANKCEDSVNLLGAEAYCVATSTAC